VGGGFAGGTARQRADLTDVRRIVILVLLALDGILCAVAATLLLPSYLGSVWFPISAVVAGAVNVVLVWAARQWTDSTRLAALPLITWLLTVAVLTVGGPGGDTMMGGAGIAALGPVLLMACGALPAVWLLLRR